MAENTVKKQRGKPFKPGQSGNPAGKPPGARHKATMLAQSLFDGEAEALTRKVIELAKAGDLQALKVCIDRLCPPMKAQGASVKIDLPDNTEPLEIGRRIVAAAAAGECPPDVAAQLLQGLGTLAKIEEVTELKARLEALEQAVNTKQTRRR